jgi:hypothetical protein
VQRRAVIPNDVLFAHMCAFNVALNTGTCISAMAIATESGVLGTGTTSLKGQIENVVLQLLLCYIDETVHTLLSVLRSLQWQRVVLQLDKEWDMCK